MEVYAYLIFCIRSDVLSMIAFIFCFQAEDGIRGLVRSRGLGDVYKRQESPAAVVSTATTLNASTM